MTDTFVTFLVLPGKTAEFEPPHQQFVRPHQCLREACLHKHASTERLEALLHPQMRHKLGGRDHTTGTSDGCPAPSSPSRAGARVWLVESVLTLSLPRTDIASGRSLGASLIPQFALFLLTTTNEIALVHSGMSVIGVGRTTG
jgi:hypothetical protein